MHEASIAEELLGILLAEARKNGDHRITHIRMRAGELSGVMPDALKFALDVMTRGTAAEGMTVEIEQVPLRIKCRDCDTEDKTEPWLFVCSKCGGRQVEIVAGRELQILDMTLDDGGETR